MEKYCCGEIILQTCRRKFEENQFQLLYWTQQHTVSTIPNTIFKTYLIEVAITDPLVPKELSDEISLDGYLTQNRSHGSGFLSL